MQLSIDIPLQARAMARRTDPATSHQAAASAQELAREHHEKILRALRRFGPLGKDAIGARCGLTGHAVGKRMPELQLAGKVALTGRKVASASGRAEREWVAL